MITAGKTTTTNRIIIAAPQGRTGKTTVTLGLLRAFRCRGLRVQPFKKGPDYIDPSWHTAAAGRASHNLDSYLMAPEQNCRTLADTAKDSDINIIEGAMGLFDGLDLSGSSSTAEIAKITRTPVILVLDPTRMTRSAAAIVMGCQHFDPGVSICGVILNKVDRLRHENMLREAIEHYCRIPVLGAIPKDSGLNIPDRHLGLVTRTEYEDADGLLDYLADIVSRHVDLDRIYALASLAGPLPQLSPAPVASGPVSEPHSDLKEIITFPVNIGVLRDKVFSFYYPENLTALINRSTRLIDINSLTDPALPADLAGLYIGGGFPEVFAPELEKNAGLRMSIRSAVESGLPVYAECGGLMYLGRSLKIDGASYEMVGSLPLDVVMEPKPQAHGYTCLQSLPDNPWFDEGLEIKGHEFHNSRIVNLDPAMRFGCGVQRGHGIDGVYDGLIYKKVFASYTHLHASGTPEWAEKFAALAKAYQFSKS